MNLRIHPPMPKDATFWSSRRIGIEKPTQNFPCLFHNAILARLTSREWSKQRLNSKVSGNVSPTPAFWGKYREYRQGKSRLYSGIGEVPDTLFLHYLHYFTILLLCQPTQASYPSVETFPPSHSPEIYILIRNRWQIFRPFLRRFFTLSICDR